MRIIITGASKGIGYEVALLLAQDPTNTILAIARDEARLQSLASQAIHQNIRVFASDITRIQNEELLEIVSAMGGVDILINNAGLLINAPFDALSRTDWQRTFEVNLFGAVDLIQVLKPLMEESKHAHILNISSMGGFQGASKFPGLSAYSASKAAIASLTECLATEFEAQKIAVNCLALGAVQTEMLAQAFPGYQAPLNANEMAAFVAYFATKGHQFFNGKILPVSLSNP